MSKFQNKEIAIFLTGRGYAMTVAARTLLPILHESGIDYEILLTEYPGHAQQVMRNEASARWRGIVTGKFKKDEPFCQPTCDAGEKRAVSFTLRILKSCIQKAISPHVIFVVLCSIENPSKYFSTKPRNILLPT